MKGGVYRMLTLRFIHIHHISVLSRYCFWVFRPYPFMCYGLHPLYFTLLYICPQTKVKRFPVCAVMVEAWYETIPFSVLSYRCSCQV